MHGGIEVTDEHDIGFYMKRAHAASHHVWEAGAAKAALGRASRLLRSVKKSEK